MQRMIIPALSHTLYVRAPCSLRSHLAVILNLFTINLPGHPCYSVDCFLAFSTAILSFIYHFFRYTVLYSINTFELSRYLVQTSRRHYRSTCHKYWQNTIYLSLRFALSSAEKVLQETNAPKQITPPLLPSPHPRIPTTTC